MNCSNVLESTYILTEIQCTNTFSTYMTIVLSWRALQLFKKEAFFFQPQSVSVFICCRNFSLYLKSDFCAYRRTLWYIIVSQWSMLLLGQQKHWAWFFTKRFTLHIWDVSRHTYEMFAAKCQTTFPAMNPLRIQVTKPMHANWIQKGKPKEEECLKETQTSIMQNSQRHETLKNFFLWQTGSNLISFVREFSKKKIVI